MVLLRYLEVDSLFVLLGKEFNMAKHITSEAAAARAKHLRQLGIHNTALANKWERIARKLKLKEEQNA